MVVLWPTYSFYPYRPPIISCYLVPSRILQLFIFFRVFRFWLWAVALCRGAKCAFEKLLFRPNPNRGIPDSPMFHVQQNYYRFILFYFTRSNGLTLIGAVPAVILVHFLCLCEPAYNDINVFQVFWLLLKNFFVFFSPKRNCIPD